MVEGGVPATDDSGMLIMRVAWKENGENSVNSNVGHAESVKGTENQGTGFKAATITIIIRASCFGSLKIY